jgi:hypothetical protein
MLTLKGKGTLFLNCKGTLTMEVDGTVQLVFDKTPDDLKITANNPDKTKTVPKLDEFSNGVSFSGKIEFSKEVKFVVNINGTITSFRLEGKASGTVSGEGSYSINGKNGVWKKNGVQLNLGKVVGRGGTTI